MKPFCIQLILLLTCAAGCFGTTVGGIEIPEEREELQLSGAGLLRKGFVFKIYVGALYLQDKAPAGRTLTDAAKRIDIHYFHKTPKKHMIREAHKTLKKNLTETEYQTMLPKIDNLHAAFRDGKKGSYASIIFRPEKGLTYMYDGEPLLTIHCDRFANAYFSIWLGDKPSSRTIKKGHA